MNAHLTLLLELQDLASKARELEYGSELGALEARHFGMDAATAAAALRKKLDELEAMLPEEVRRRYKRVAERGSRVVVPVVAGTCYGCYEAVPTKDAGEQDPNANLRACEHCGRFLYFPG